MSTDPWATDPDRTTRNNDTRTSDQVLRSVTNRMPCVWCPEHGWHDPMFHA